MESEKRFSLQKSEICSKVFTDKSNEWDKGRILTSYLARRAKHLSLLRSPALLALAYWSLQCSAMWARPIVIIACSSMMMLLLPPPPPPSSSVGTLNQKWEISFQNEPWLNLEDSTSYSLNCCPPSSSVEHWTRIEKYHSKMNLDWILKTLLHIHLNAAATIVLRLNTEPEWEISFQNEPWLNFEDSIYFIFT